MIDERTNLLTDIQKNERVGLLSDHPINNLINYFAIHNLGGLPCFLNHQWSESTVKQLVEKYQIEWLIQDKELLSTGCDDKTLKIILKIRYFTLDLLQERQVCLKLIIGMNLRG